jgi:hypothetical protein
MKANFTELVTDLARILRGGATYQEVFRRDDGTYFTATRLQDCPARDWHTREQIKYPLHPAVEKALASDHRPHDWHLLTLEWPHVSETDSSRIAYTRDERAGMADRQVITTVGKYITRHFPTMPDHEVRNLAALFAVGDSCKFVHTMAEMLYHLVNGPSSCMAKDFDVRCEDGVRRHPYQVYDPKYGWHMAVFVRNGVTLGRALCMREGDTGYYVRSYRRDDNYSHSDERLESWLESQGYSKQDYWERDTKLALYKANGGEILAPFIDGGHQYVDICGNHLEISSSGEYECSNTSGYASGGGEQCDDCGDRFSEGDGYWVGRYEDSQVCQSCCDNNYYYSYGARGHQYYVHQDNVVHVGDEVYDEDYLSDNGIVALEDGDYAQMDDCVLINDDWYLTDDDRICRPEDSDDYCLTEDCWQCEESGNWYTDDTASVEIAGCLYHPDNAPEQETTEE